MNNLLTFFFPNLSTHRVVVLHPATTTAAIPSFFPYENAIAALSVYFCRYTVKDMNEPRYVRCLFAFLLAALRFSNRVDYKYLVIVHFCTYLGLIHRICHRIVSSWLSISKEYKKDGTSAPQSTLTMYSLSTTILITSIFIGMMHQTSEDPFFTCTQIHSLLIPIPGYTSIYTKIQDTLQYLFPIQEVYKAYHTLLLFVSPSSTLHTQNKHLFYVTANIQVGMGFLGIYFLRKEQERKNEIILLETQVQKQQQQ